jgi:hypothetical protein
VREDHHPLLIQQSLPNLEKPSHTKTTNNLLQAAAHVQIGQLNVRPSFNQRFVEVVIGLFDNLKLSETVEKQLSCVL